MRNNYENKTIYIWKLVIQWNPFSGRPRARRHRACNVRLELLGAALEGLESAARKQRPRGTVILDRVPPGPWKSVDTSKLFWRQVPSRFENSWKIGAIWWQILNLPWSSDTLSSKSVWKTTNLTKRKTRGWTFQGHLTKQKKYIEIRYFANFLSLEPCKSVQPL